MDNVREETMKALKQHKSSWLLLGKHLTKIALQELYKDWGFDDFTGYIAEELGLSKATARSMMVAFEYIQKHQPSILNTIESGNHAYVPDYHTICQLSKARSKSEIDDDWGQSLHERAFSDDPKAPKMIQQELRDAQGGGEEIMDDIRKQTVSVKRSCKKLHKKIYETSSFGNPVHELADQLLDEVNKVEV